MNRFDRLRKHSRPLVLLLFTAVCTLSRSTEVRGDSDQPAPSLLSPGNGFRLQESDPIATPLKPVTPRSEPTERKLDALSWYMTGRVLEIRGEQLKAYDAYRQAIELDPTAAEVYRSLVPLAFQLPGKDDEGVKYATKAVELLPEDHELLRQLGEHLAVKKKIPEAIRYLQQAADSPKIQKNTIAYVLLMRELGILYAATGQRKPAGDAYAVVFEALQNPEKYGLDLRTKRRLLLDPLTSYERIGQILLEGEHVELAAKAFEEAANSGRSGAGNLAYFRSKVLYLTNKPEEALQELQTYFDGQRQSKGRDAYVLLGEILQKLNRGDELIGRLEELAEKDPHNKTLQYFLAEQLVAAGNLEKAKSIYDAALEGSGDSTGYIGLAAVLRKMNRPSELLDTLGQTIMKVGPEGLEGLEAELQSIAADEKLLPLMIAAGRAQHQADPSQLTFEESYLLAKLAARKELIDESAEFYRIALPLNKASMPFLYDELVKLYLNVNRYAEAAKVLEEAADEKSLADRRADYLYRLSYAREMAGDTEGAVAAIRETQQLIPDDPAVQYQEGWIYYHAKKFEQAIAVYEKVMARFPDKKEIVRRCQFTLSNIFVLSGDSRKGEEILERVLAEDPDDPAVNNDLGYLYADQGKNLEQAEKMIRKAVASDPENAAYQDSLGWVLFKLGRFEEARAPLEKAVANSKGSGDATLLDHLGDLYLRLNLVEQAVEIWDKALKHAELEGESEANLKERLTDKLKQHKK